MHFNSCSKYFLKIRSPEIYKLPIHYYLLIKINCMRKSFQSGSLLQNYLSKKNLIKQPYFGQIIFIAAFCFVANCGQAQIIAGWNFWNDGVIVTKSASVFDPNLVSPVDLTRGVGAPASVGLDIL